MNGAKPDIASLTGASALPWFLAALFDWGIIITVFHFVNVIGAWYAYPVAAFVIGTRQHALTLLAHDGAHYLVFKNRFANDVATGLVAFWPLGLGLDSYRAIHFAHHRHLSSDKDPEMGFKKRSAPSWDLPATRQQIVKQFLANLCGLGVLQMRHAAPDLAPRSARDYGGVALVWGAALTLSCFTGAWHFILLWTASLFTSFWACFVVRTWTEHPGIVGTPRFHAGPVARFVFFPHNTHCHWEHHEYAAVPFSNMLKLRALCETPRLQDSPKKVFAALEHAPAVKSGDFIAESAVFLLIFLMLLTPQNLFATTKAGIVTSHPLATAAGARVLSQGGSAADAAVAAALTLAVVEPSHSGLGGGGVAIHFDKVQNQWSEFDYMESIGLEAVAGVEPMLPEKKNAAAKSVAVPGFIAGLEKIHKRFGKLAWDELFTDAIRLATDGFALDTRYPELLKLVPENYAKDADFKLFFIDQAIGKAPVLKQENLAKTLQKLSDGGAKEFYSGALSKAILSEATKKQIALHDGDLTYYETRVLEPQGFFFKDLRIFAPSSPSFGAPFLDHLLRAYRVSKVTSDAPDFPKFLETETGKFLAKNDTFKTDAPIKSGYASFVLATDAKGNVVSMVNTLHGLFGSGIVLNGTGILMNAAGADTLMKKFLSESDAANNYTLAKRPLHFLTPLIMFRGFDEVVAIATDGGFTTPVNSFQILVKAFSEGDSLTKALKAPKFYPLPTVKQNLYEKGFPAKILAAKLAAPVTVSPYPVGNVGLLHIFKGGIKTLADERSLSTGEVLVIKGK